MLFINSPANPTGGVLTRDDLTRIAELAIEHDLWVVADEIYGRILYDGAEHVSIASLPGMAERTIILDGFSKTFAMTGWRLGYAVVPESLIPTYAQLIINTISCAPTFAQVGAVEALVGPQDDVDAMVVEFKARRDLVVAGLNDIPGIRCATAARGVLRVPVDRGDRVVRRGARRAAAARGRRLRPGRDGVRWRGHRAHPDLVRELAREPDRGARSDRPVRRGAGPWLTARPSGRGVFVARIIPDEGLDAIRAACEMDLWEDDAAAAAGRAAAPGRRLRRRPDPADRPGRRRVPRRGRAAAPRGRQQLRRRVRQHRRRGVRAARHPGRQHAGRPDRDDRRPRLGPADGRRPAAARGRPLRARRPLEDVGPAAAARPGRPRRDDRHRRLRADRPGGGPPRAGVRDGDPVPRRPASCPRDVTEPLGATFLPLEELLARSDFVSLHVNLSDR